MLLQKILSNIVLALSASATVLPVTNEFSGPDELAPKQRVALNWALDLIEHGVGVYRNVASNLFLVKYDSPASGLVSRQTLLLDGAGQLINALSPVITDSLKRPCVRVPPKIDAGRALELTGLGVEDLPTLPKAQAEECEEERKVPKGTDILTGLLDRLPLVNN